MCNHLKKTLHSDSFLTRHKTAPQHFTRDRHLSFSTIILFLLNLIKHSLQTELDTFFQTLENRPVSIRQVTKSAFSQARHKCSYQAFIELNTEAVSYFEQHADLRTWHGHRVLAIDGTTLRLPSHPDILRQFGNPQKLGIGNSPQARVSQLYDVLNHITLDAEIQPYQTGEREIALSHAPSLRPNDLLVFDRGYPAFWFFAWLRSHSVQYCARVTDSTWTQVKEFKHSTVNETTVTLCSTSLSCVQCRQLGLSDTPLRVRLIRVARPQQDDEIFMTSLLDTQTYPYELFDDLYHLRWGIEEQIKNMKCRIQIEQFSGKTPEAIQQDLHAKILSLNLTAMFIHPVQDQVDRDSQTKQYRYQVNFTFALSTLKHTLVRIFQQSRPFRLLETLLFQFRINTEPIRPNRSSPRQKRFRDHNLHPMSYKNTP